MPGNTKVIVLCVVILKKSYCKLSKTLWSTLKLAKNSDQTKAAISILYLTILTNFKNFLKKKLALALVMITVTESNLTQIQLRIQAVTNLW